jgi:hypothetical protein
MRSHLPTRIPSRLLAAAGVGVTALALMAQYGGVDPWWEAGSGRALPMFAQFQDATGDLTVLNMDGPIATRDHPFFESVGSNGRACITCHQPSSAMGLAVERIRQQYEDSRGKDPVFAAIDGANCPTLPQSARSSHSLLLDRGLFRIYLPLPAHADFKVEVVRDPTGCNTDSVYGLASAHPVLSVFRRPRVVANLKWVLASDSGFALNAPRSAGLAAALAADGRDGSLAQQAAEAMHAHEQTGRDLTAEELQQILDFESQIFVAQTSDRRGGDLTEVGGPLGAWTLGFNKLPKQPATRPVFMEAGYWRSPVTAARPAARTEEAEFRASVARGNALFTSRSFSTAGVAGFPAATGTCAACHNAPGAGSNLAQQAMDVGTTVYASPDRAPTDLPLFKITCGTGRVLYTSDPGRALVTGRCADVGAIVMQQFRGLSARAPYFSNGSAETLRDVVDFYDRRFHIALTEPEKQDLVNFLSVL